MIAASQRRSTIPNCSRSMAPVALSLQTRTEKHGKGLPWTEKGLGLIVQRFRAVCCDFRGFWVRAAHVWGSRSRWFKSSRPDHEKGGPKWPPFLLGAFQRGAGDRAFDFVEKAAGSTARSGAAVYTPGGVRLAQPFQPPPRLLAWPLCDVRERQESGSFGSCAPCHTATTQIVSGSKR